MLAVHPNKMPMNSKNRERERPPSLSLLPSSARFDARCEAAFCRPTPPSTHTSHSLCSWPLLYVSTSRRGRGLGRPQTDLFTPAQPYNIVMPHRRSAHVCECDYVVGPFLRNVMYKDMLQVSFYFGTPGVTEQLLCITRADKDTALVCNI